jgi:hypothetical protein
MFQTVPLSIIRSFSLYTQQWYMSFRFADSLQAGSGCSFLILLTSCLQTCMTYTIVVCTVKNSWWCTEELSETCRVSFQNKFEKLLHLCVFYYKKSITMHGHVNVKHWLSWDCKGYSQSLDASAGSRVPSGHSSFIIRTFQLIIQ